MELVVFDLDGTLLNGASLVSDHTRDTLASLRERGIAYTVATGRTLHAAKDLLEDHGFSLPHIYKNGVIVWRPENDTYIHTNLLTQDEIRHVLEAFIKIGITPFIFTLEEGNRHVVYHTPLQTDAEKRLIGIFANDRGLEVLPTERLPALADITNISALGTSEAISALEDLVAGVDHLVAYGGPALEGQNLYWIDIHHSAASKGAAVTELKRDLGATQVICFGDSDNDLSMFAMADECYAPSNAKDEVLAAATAVIGHHDEDGISHFLRERFEL
ncbi:MAG: Cof subfamily protein (haloacid dehalogenase superfamily) [Bacteroidia bacterium]|jgi:Cof subfamily protein (haloacid dehalogenase superfamily)